MNSEMEFINLIEFFQKKEHIRKLYKRLDEKEKRIYKMYVYSLPFMKEDVKDLIWDYLNGYDECIFELAKRYREDKTKLEKRKKNAIFYNDET